MNAVTEFRARLPMPRELVNDEIDARRWRVLCETTFPSARSSESILMAIDYCRARGLDIFKKPIHIVPMWNATLGREVETCWPGINEVQITAARTGAWAGMDEPKWGEEVTRTFKGRKREKGGWKDAEAGVTFPAWCVVTVHRMVGGAPRAFAEPVYWLEAYSRAGGSELPTDMWIKRPRGQLQKVAKAASLRAAFPEEGEYTAEEMEGKEIEAGGVVIDAEPPARKSSAAAKRDGDWPRFQAALADCQSAREVEMLRVEWQRDFYPAWNKDWQAVADEALEKRLAEFSEPEHLEETLQDSIEIEQEQQNYEPLRDMLIEKIESMESVEDLMRLREREDFQSVLGRLPKPMQLTVRKYGAARMEKLPTGP